MKTLEEPKPLIDIKVNDEERLLIIKKEYKGKVYYDIRRWFLGKGMDKPAPTKRGFTISQEVFKEQKEAISRI